MAILSGRNGQVLYDPAGITPVALININNWKASFKTAYIDVTVFGATNKAKVPDLPDVNGTMAGFWNSSARELFTATSAATPGLLKLVPNTTEATFFWSGLAYIDADIDVDVNGAPKVTSAWTAAGNFTMAP